MAPLARHVKREPPTTAQTSAATCLRKRELALDAATFEVVPAPGTLICEDAWFAEPAEQAASAGAQALLVLNASPFHMHKQRRRTRSLNGRASASPPGLPVPIAHRWVARTSWCSMALFRPGRGKAAARRRAPCLRGLRLAALCRRRWRRRAKVRWRRMRRRRVAVEGALVMGRATTWARTASPAPSWACRVADSALVLAVAVDALGPTRCAPMMPPPYTAEISWGMPATWRPAWACSTTRSISVRCSRTSRALSFDFAGKPEDATEENIQARVRGTLPWRHVQQERPHRADHRQQERDGYRLLHAVRRHGRRLRGHQGPGQDPRLPPVANGRTRSHAAGHWRNRRGHPRAHHHAAAFGRAAPDQTDQDSLPPYEVLDAILERYMENDLSPSPRCWPTASSPADVERVTRLCRSTNTSAARRRCIRVTPRGFGRDWRYPITSNSGPERPDPHIST